MIIAINNITKYHVAQEMSMFRKLVWIAWRSDNGRDVYQTIARHDTEQSAVRDIEARAKFHRSILNIGSLYNEN